MPVRGAPDEQVVPHKRIGTVSTYHNEIEVFIEKLDPPDEVEVTTEKKCGKFQVLQAVGNNGQGYYLCSDIQLKKYAGPALVKYLGGRNEITRQFRDYSDATISTPTVAAQVQLSGDRKNPGREIKFAQELIHDNIVKIVAFFALSAKPEDIYAIIMEGAFDGSLDVYASRAQIPLNLVKTFALQLARALEYCHSKNILHRDVRTRNIYVQNGRSIKLGNFGYAREANSSQQHTANKTEELYYRAPEMISTEDITEYGLSVDIYGFSMVLWSMLHEGKKPFHDDPECQKLFKNETKFRQYLKKGNRPEINDDVDEKLADLIKKCWICEDEFQRRPTASEVVKSLLTM